MLRQFVTNTGLANRLLKFIGTSLSSPRVQFQGTGGGPDHCSGEICARCVGSGVLGCPKPHLPSCMLLRDLCQGPPGLFSSWSGLTLQGRNQEGLRFLSSHLSAARGEWSSHGTSHPSVTQQLRVGTPAPVLAYSSWALCPQKVQ